MSHVVESQEPVFALLADPASHGGSPVKRIDTHAASVFLVGDRALKVKRAVRFPFLDFSDPDKRRAACQAELAANRPFAPDIYRRVVPITRENDGRLAIDGNGTPVDWAVEMRRFDENATLDHLAEAGKIDCALAEELGRAVAAGHRAAPIIEARPWIEALASFIEQNDAEFRETPDLFPPPAVAALGAASRDAFARARPMLVARGQIGLVRRGHGDLHLGNIVLIDGKPVLFDALEFDPLIAAGDVLYDLAFLLMDLLERELTPAANVVLNRYLGDAHRDEDLDGLAALPLFLSLRAAIRAKVTAARAEQSEAPKRATIEHDAKIYFDLACRLIAPPPPTLVAVGGLSGTGKSVLARRLAPELSPAPGAVVLRTDVERKALFGRAENEPLPSDAYAASVTKKVYATLCDKARRVIAAGHSAVVDAVFSTPAERAAAAAIAPASNVPFHGLFLTADLNTRMQRIGRRTADASDADAVVARQQEYFDLGAIDWTGIDAGGTPESTLEAARSVISGQ
jgi:aminoglycoside phosphotransferase family enzyme/predicted kinase